MDLHEEAWIPTPRQAEFLACPDFEVLYGGAAGGGKTDALIFDALGLNNPNGPDFIYQAAWQNPFYRGLMIRPSRNELIEVIDRCRRWYPKIDPGVQWFETKNHFEFSSGARIEFSYLKEENDRFRYASREFQYVGWEELTQHPTAVGYTFLKSRVRSPKKANIRCFIRSTTNPNGVGHSWVKAHWQIPDEGTPTSFPVEEDDGKGNKRSFTRRFIPAKISDNPHIDDNYVFTLSAMSEDDQRALREGRWDTVQGKGLVYQNQIEHILRSGRRTNVPWSTHLPVNTFWDLGRSDTTAVWFHQHIDGQNRFIDYLEGSQQGLDYYARELKRRPYVYGEHYLPHDAKHKTLAQPKSLQELIEQLGLRPTVIVPRIDSVANGIELVRAALSTCWFDEVRTRDGFEALKNYRYKFDEKTQAFSQTPKHDKWSHASDALRQFAQGWKGPRTNWGAYVDGASKRADHTRRDAARKAVRDLFRPKDVV